MQSPGTAARLPLVLGLLLAVVWGAAAQSADAQGASDQGRVAQAFRLGAGGIRLDGAMSEEAWRGAEPVGAFVQREPTEGAAPTHRTEARILYDDAAIYIGVRAFDSEPDRILGYLTRRDTDSASDWIRVLIDSYHDRRTAYEFIVNPVGVKRDKYYFNDNDDDESWDAVWDVAVLRDPGGWCAEFRIPYSQLRFSSGTDATLGFAIAREVARLNETSTWPLLPRGASGYVSSFGELAGVTRPPGGKRLEMAPYVLGQINTKPEQPGNPLLQTPDPGGAVGLDLKYAITPSISFTGTINPDFGQVEADPAEVNLSAFETFFDERRPFFVEGSGTYRFDCDDCQLFYSRRIGRPPRGAPDAGDGGYELHPGQSTILGAGKLTGRVGAFSAGVLTAVTQEERAQIAFGDERRTEAVEPQTFYSVSRVRREFADQSSLGLILTTANRGRQEALSFLPDTALATGVDYDWRLGQRWSLTGFWSGTHVAGSTTAITALQRSNVHSYQRPDADHVEFDPDAETLNGQAGSMSLGKIAGDKVRGNVMFAYKTPGFDVNELGYQRRADDIVQRAWVQRRFMDAGKYVRTKIVNFNQYSRHNFAGDRLELGTNVNTHWEFQNLWSAGGGVNLNSRTFDDRITRGGPGAYQNPNISGWQYFNSDDSRMFSFHWDLNFDIDFSGEGAARRSSGLMLYPRLAFRPTSALSGEIGVSVERNTIDAQWVASVASADRTHHVLGRLDQTTTFLNMRLSYALTPNLSLQLYGQPFSSAGRYENYKELINGRAGRHADRYAPFAYEGNADFTVLSFRTTNVLRWEFKPGSALFVVWQQGREGFHPHSDFRFRRDYRDIFTTPSSNTVLVKLSYWLNP